MEKETKKINVEKENKKLIAIIRISGMVKVATDIAKTLDRLRLRRKYACVLINPNKNNLGMLEKVKHYVAYGEINKETLSKLLKERAKSIKGNKKEIKIEEQKIAEELFSGKKLSDFGLKPFFRLHPPRKGINSKKPYSIGGVLGYNKGINELIERML